MPTSSLVGRIGDTTAHPITASILGLFSYYPLSFRTRMFTLIRVCTKCSVHCTHHKYSSRITQTIFIVSQIEYSLAVFCVLMYSSLIHTFYIPVNGSPRKELPSTSEEYLWGTAFFLPPWAIVRSKTRTSLHRKRWTQNYNVTNC